MQTCPVDVDRQYADQMEFGGILVVGCDGRKPYAGGTMACCHANVQNTAMHAYLRGNQKENGYC